MKSAVALLLVALQLVLLALLVVLPRGGLWLVWIPEIVVAAVLILGGLALAAVGLVRLGPALTASPIPREDGALVTTGVYRRMRHPVYSGLLLGGLGFVVIGASVWHCALWVVLFVLLWEKARWEERMLTARFADYPAYVRRSGRLLPRIRAIAEP